MADREVLVGLAGRSPAFARDHEIGHGKEGHGAQSDQGKGGALAERL